MVKKKTIDKSSSLFISDLITGISSKIDFKKSTPLYALQDAGGFPKGNSTALELIIFYSLDSGHPLQLQLWKGLVFDEDDLTRNYDINTFRWVANADEFNYRYGRLKIKGHPIVDRVGNLTLKKLHEWGWPKDQPLSNKLKQLLILTAGILEQDRRRPVLDPKVLREDVIMRDLINVIKTIGDEVSIKLGPEKLAWLTRSKKVNQEVAEVLAGLPIDWLIEAAGPILEYKTNLSSISVPFSEIIRPEGARRLLSVEDDIN